MRAITANADSSMVENRRGASESAMSCVIANGQKTRPGAPEQELIAHLLIAQLLVAQRLLKIKQARQVFCQARFPASLIYAIYVLPAHRPLSRRLLCRFPLVILQQAAQSFIAENLAASSDEEKDNVGALATYLRNRDWKTLQSP